MTCKECTRGYKKISVVLRSLTSCICLLSSPFALDGHLQSYIWMNCSALSGSVRQYYFSSSIFINPKIPPLPSGHNFFYSNIKGHAMKSCDRLFSSFLLHNSAGLIQFVFSNTVTLSRSMRFITGIQQIFLFLICYDHGLLLTTSHFVHDLSSCYLWCLSIIGLKSSNQMPITVYIIHTACRVY